MKKDTLKTQSPFELDSSLSKQKNPSSKKALVFGGGGSKGAYQIGAYEALCEEGFEFDLVVGVSIGAINGAMIAQGDFAKAKELWLNLTLEDVIDKGLNLTFDMDYYFDNTQKILPFLKTYTQNKGMDITPLQKTIAAYIDYNKLANSPIDFGLLCLEVPSFNPCEKQKAQMDENSLLHWLLASASCFPAFPIYEIAGQKYIDGGYYDNLPIDLAFKMGASDIFAISLNPDCETKYDKNPLVRHLRPSHYLGTMLDFTPNNIKRNMRIGYLDMKRALSYYCGKYFAFYTMSAAESSMLESIAKKLLCFLLTKELDTNTTPPTLSSLLSDQMARTGILSKITSSTPFCDKLLILTTQHNHQKPTLQDIGIALLEGFMEVFCYDDLKVWKVNDVLDSATNALHLSHDNLLTSQNTPTNLNPQHLQDLQEILTSLKTHKPNAALLEKTPELMWCTLLALSLSMANM